MGEKEEIYNLVHSKIKYPQLSLDIPTTINELNLIERKNSIKSSSLSEKKRKKTLKNVEERSELVFKPKLPKSFYVTKLRDWAEEIPITGLLIEWENKILDLISSQWKFKYPSVLMQLLLEIRETYVNDMQTFAIDHIVLNSTLDNYKYIIQQSEITNSSSCVAATFNRNKQFLERNYFLSHSLIRNIIDMACLKFGGLVVDLSEQHYRGLLEFDDLKKLISKSIKNSSYTLKHNYYKEIAKILSSKYSLASIDKTRIKTFIKCATNVFVQQVLNNKMETIDKIICAISNFKYCPKINFTLKISEYSIIKEEEEEKNNNETISISPSIKQVYEFYHQVIRDIDNIGNNDLFTFESLIMISENNDYIKIKIPEWFIIKSHDKLDKILDSLFKPIVEYYNEIKRDYNFICSLKTINNIKQLVSSSLDDYHVYCNCVKKFNKYKLKANTMLAHLRLSIGRVSQVDAKRSLLHNTTIIIDILVEKLVSDHWKYNESIYNEFESLKIMALNVPKNAKELFKLTEAIAIASTTTIDKLENKIMHSIEMLSDLMEITSLTEQHIEFNRSTINWLSSIKLVFNNSNTACEAMKSELEDELQRNINCLNSKIECVIPEFVILNNMDDATRVGEYIEYLDRLVDKINDIDNTIQAINTDEKLFKFPETNFDKIEDIKEIIMPFYSLNFKINKWQRYHNVWLDGPFDYINSTQVSEITNFYSEEFLNFNKTMKTKIKLDMTANKPFKFSGIIDDPDPMQQPAPLKLCHQAIAHVNSFKKHIDLMNCMCNPALATRHWNEMSVIYGRDITPNAGTTLRKIIQLNITSDIEKYQVISISANKEQILEKQLNTMIDEWNYMIFDIINIEPDDKNSLMVFRHFEKIQIHLEEHLVMIQEMRGSYFVKPIVSEVLEFHKSLITVRDTIDMWNIIQNNLISIRPIFSNNHQALENYPKLKEIGNIYLKIEKKVENIKSNLLKDPSFHGITKSENYILDNLNKIMKNMEIINEGIVKYLNDIRFIFPRFFFQSNDNVMNILFNKNNVFMEKINLLLEKCFSGMKKAVFNFDADVVAIVSSLDDEMPLSEKVENSCTTSWLINLEKSIINTVRKNIIDLKNTYKDYSMENVLGLIITNADCSIKKINSTISCVLKILWTLEIEKSFIKSLNDSVSLQNVFNKINDNIINIIKALLSIIKCNDGNSRALKRSQRVIIISQIILLVHQRDILTLTLINKRVTSNNDFNWLIQLKHYWHEENVKVEMLNVSRNYGYEFNSPGTINHLPIVNTLLTERVYTTIFQAGYYHNFGSVAGQTGTGKTETIKALATTELARQFHLINCNQETQFSQLSRILKGMILSGAWLCLKNLLQTEVSILSAVSQYIFQLSQLLASDLKVVNFDGDSLALNSNGFITMTTTSMYCYSQWEQITTTTNKFDSVKAVFRQVTLTQPDIEKICQIKLYAAGFTNGQELAMKICTIYKLCEEQLVDGNAYVFDSRAVISIIRNSIELKFNCPEIKDEEAIVLRVLIDINIAMLKERDVITFQDFLKDVFPAVSLPPPNYKNFLSALSAVAETKGLQLHPVMKLKIIQILEMMYSRKSFILIGEAMLGKTTMLKTLASCLTQMNYQNDDDDDAIGAEVSIEIINQKSINLKYNSIELFDMEINTKRRWIVFDGPVEIYMTEYFQSVLENVESMKMLSVIFETNDISETSPAVISRCGIIHTEDADGTYWKPLTLAWINRQPITNKQMEYLKILLDWSLEPCLNFIYENCHFFLKVSRIYLIMSILRLLEIYLKEIMECIKEESKECHFEIWIHASLIMSIVWSLGAVLSLNEHRAKLNEFCTYLWNNDGNKINRLYPKPEIVKTFDVCLPSEGMIQDSTFVFKGVGLWKAWTEILKNSNDSIVTSRHYSIVPTVENIKLIHQFENHLQAKIPFIICGEESTGKTLLMKYLLKYKLFQTNNYTINESNFTAETTAEEAQIKFHSKINKISKDKYGPLKNKICINFIDDLNLMTDISTLKKCKKTSPLELIRQQIDHGYWYQIHKNNKTIEKVFINNVMFLFAMTPTMNTRLCSRFIRHLNIYTINPPSKENIFRIFSTILVNNLKQNLFSADIVSTANSMVHSTIHVYMSMIKNLQPINYNTIELYKLNLRDIGRVINGCSLIHRESAETKITLIRLWVHESLRVFGDRLSNKLHANWLFTSIKEAISIHFNKESFDSLFDHLPKNKLNQLTSESFRDLVFCNFMDSGNSSFMLNDNNDGDSDGDGKNNDNNVDDKSLVVSKYEEVLCSQETLNNKVIALLNQYNDSNKNIEKLDLLIFKNILEHLIRICRCLCLKTGGNLLMVCADGGIGGRSLARLAAFIQKQEFFEVAVDNINLWRNKLKDATRQSGGYGRDCTFFIPGRYMKVDKYLADISSVMSTGEVPGLFSCQDEIQAIIEIARLPAQHGDRNSEIEINQVMDYFHNQCKEKLHFVMYGDLSMTMNKAYPSILKNCLIDYYEEWPEEAFYLIGNKFIKDIKSNVVSQEKLSTISLYLFQSTIKNVNKSVDPMAFIEMMKLYNNLVKKKQNDVKILKNKYLGGLKKMELAAEEVLKMKTTLTALRPQLELSAKQTEETMQQIEAENISVANATIQVKRDEEIANKTAEIAATLKTECEADLAVAIPILEDAIAALNTLKPTDITLVKAMKNPPDTVKLVMAAVCVMLSIPADRVIDPVTGKKFMDFWGPSKRILGDMNFLQNLKDYDKDNIPPSLMQIVKKTYITDKNFMPHIVAKASSAAEGLCKWVRAMVSYDDVAKIVAPKRARECIATKKCNETMAFLNEKRKTLTALNDKLTALNEDLEATLAKKLKLENQVMNCSSKLEKAEYLIENLGDEKDKWMKTAESLEYLYENIPIDVLISCGIIFYLAPLDSVSRHEIVKVWINYLVTEQGLLSYSYSSLKKCLKMEHNSAVAAGDNAFYQDNSIIIQYSRPWCILIDPQNLANSWIRQLEKKNKLEIIKFTDPEYVLKIEESMTVGQPILLENVDDNFIKTEIFDFTCLTNNKNLNFYITTRLATPRFIHDPYIIKKTTIVNFHLPEDALNNNLLDLLMAREKSNLQEQYLLLKEKNKCNKIILKQEEENILMTLSNPVSSTVSILEDEKAMKILDSFKILSLNVKEKNQLYQEIKKKIEISKNIYKEFTYYCGKLYKNLEYLKYINYMYQFSLEWFIKLYIKSIATSKRSAIIEKRLRYLKNSLTQNFHKSIKNALFDNDKLVYSFLLSITILSVSNEITNDECNLLSKNIKNLRMLNEKNDRSSIITVLMDLESKYEIYKGITDTLNSNNDTWKEFFLAENPYTQELPNSWQIKLSNFQRVILLCILKPDKIIIIITEFVLSTMKKMDINLMECQRIQDNIADAYSESSCLIPLIFILPSYLEPFQLINEFGTKLGYSSKIFRFTFGAGRHVDEKMKLAELIESCRVNGGWLLIENIDNASIQGKAAVEEIYENILNDMSVNTAIGFRLWLSSRSTKYFPIGMLQNGIKVTCDKPSSIKQTLVKSYHSQPLNNTSFFCSCPGKDKIFTKILYSLAFFHAILQEKKNFGYHAWNVNYDFNHFDFCNSINQLKYLMLLNNCKPSSIVEGLNYLIAECNYGGKMTDNYDKEYLMTIFTDFCNLKIIEETNYSLFTSTYRVDENLFPSSITMPSNRCEYHDYIKHIDQLPNYTTTQQVIELLGLGDNAAHQVNQSIVRDFIYSLDQTLNINNYNNNDDDDERREKKMIIKDKLCGLLDIDKAIKKYPINYLEPVNVVLRQEIHHYNCAVKIINKLLLADENDENVKNKAIISGILSVSIIDNNDECINQLSIYVDKMNKSFDFFNNWIDKGFPRFSIELSLFFSPKKLISIIKTMFVRQTGTNFEAEIVMDCDYSASSFSTLHNIENSFGIKNIYLLGAAWDEGQRKFIPSQAKIIYTIVPLIVCHFELLTNNPKVAQSLYPCPLYKSIKKSYCDNESMDYNTLHVVNFIDKIHWLTDLPNSYWIKRATAFYSHQ